MDQFDYVIVGGGAAGCVLASRLSEDPAVRVCLLEAGGAGRNWLVRVPFGMVVSVPTRLINWGFKTVPQKALNGRRLYQPRGRALGGSSAINAMIYTRGHPSDYDAWAAAGNSGWSWSEVLPHFKRAEANARWHDDYHGSDGPLPVSDSFTDNPMQAVFLEAARQAGFPLTEDFNGARQEGVGVYQLTQRDGERWSAARAYLEPYVARPNLCVLTGARVRRVLFDGRRAHTVEYHRDGKLQTVAARAEIIMCAGSFQSPQLLMLSGIGDAEVLRRHGIEVVQHLPGVGQNLQDHLDYTLIHRARSLDLIGFSPRGVARLLREVARYRREHRGMLATNVAEAGGFLKTDPALPKPDVQLHFCVAIVHNHGRTLRHLWHGYSLHVCVLRPASRGQVRLASPDSEAAPAIDPAYLSDVRDLDVLVRGFKLARRILNAPAFAPYRRRELFTAGVQSDEDIRAVIRARAETIYHPVGSCRMGNDALAVVDAELRVRSVQGLRVVDASVMPTLIGGNTQAPTVMIAEKAADLLRRTKITAP
ncbi:MAG: choline dehydrogenase [Gammaproteobacteria bacterium]|nr:choline dehydrogenase [Gammaproteobacteria bacterium]MDE2109276.1 choline dehydrogenase [Gammaproteobacteria bacterium]MDE2461650.1 choline dehydrogenase [Gammaproteobacteria bacterium]